MCVLVWVVCVTDITFISEDAQGNKCLQNNQWVCSVKSEMRMQGEILNWEVIIVVCLIIYSTILIRWPSGMVRWWNKFFIIGLWDKWSKKDRGLPPLVAQYMEVYMEGKFYSSILVRLVVFGRQKAGSTANVSRAPPACETQEVQLFICFVYKLWI